MSTRYVASAKLLFKSENLLFFSLTDLIEGWLAEELTASEDGAEYCVNDPRECQDLPNENSID